MSKIITLVSLFPKQTAEIADEVCDILNKFLLVASDLVDYEISDKTEMENTCGKDYLDKCINKVLSSITDYENAIVAMDYNLLFRPKILERFKEKTNIVFIKLDKDYEQLLAKDYATFEDREKRICNNSKLIIDATGLERDEIVLQVVRQITPLIASEV